MIYIVLPAYNEERTLLPLLEAIRENMDEARLPYRVIVVNDGSTDGTVRVVREAEGTMPIALIEHPQNKGLAETLKTGLLSAVGYASPKDIIITMDADNTHTPGLIMTMTRMIREGHDVVIGSRYRKGSRVIGVSFLRRLLSFGASLIFRNLFPIKGVKDYTSGYRAYRAQVIKDMFNAYGDAFISQPGFSAMVDVLLKIRKYPVIIGEAPLILRYDQKAGESKMKVAKTIGETLRLILKRL
ncbi:MAG: glycosyltransferase family 2 protein [Nitrospirae bacterium]|nr:glycosyltransferase family 2 protein [Nitrospirota bacterium]